MLEELRRGSHSAEELTDELDVLLHGVLRGNAVSALPGLELGLALEVEHSGLVLVLGVAELGLLEERIDLELLLVGELASNLGVFLELLGGSFKLFLKRH